MATSLHLDVPGAIIHYIVQGSGPTLLLIPGATGEHTVFEDVAKQLSTYFMVVSYDRRGFSRSYLTAAQDYANRLSTDVDDAKQLIQHVSEKPAFVLGNSSGAIVAIELLIQYPGVVERVFAHEAPLIQFHPEGAWWRDFFLKCYDKYVSSGILLSARLFAEGIASGVEEAAGVAKVFDAREGDFVGGNAMYWYERELRQYPCAVPNMEVLGQRADKLVLAGGRESSETSCYLPVNRVLAKRFRKKILEFPGSHGGYVTHPEEFARVMCAAALGEARLGE
ncbi:hypothetical protein APSETT444_003245 [Aspergillus pseudonomiae]